MKTANHFAFLWPMLLCVALCLPTNGQANPPYPSIVGLEGPSAARVTLQGAWQATASGTNPHPAAELAVAADHAYAIGTEGFQVIDVSNPVKPGRVGQLASGGRNLSFPGVAVSGDVAFTTTDTNRLLVINISNPEQPRLVQSLTVGTAFNHIAAAGERVFLTTPPMGWGTNVLGALLIVMDVTNPTSPRDVGSLNLGVPPGDETFTVELRQVPGEPSLGANTNVAVVIRDDDRSPVDYRNDNGTITNTRYIGSGGAVTIPRTIDGLPVTTIGEPAFQGCNGLTSVTTPNSVTSIGASAFSRCSSVTSASIGNRVTNIGDFAFYYCANLASVAIPNSVSTGLDASVESTAWPSRPSWASKTWLILMTSSSSGT